MEKFKFLKRKKADRLPKAVGVYAFRNDGKLLYIGKAVNLRERIKQHRKLLSRAKQIGYIKTDSEIEALLLEANLIKKFQPKYNIVWRDDKNYFYIAITKEPFPRIFITHQIKSPNTKYKILNTKFIGPFVDGSALKKTLKVLRKIFPYYTQKKHPKDPCPWCHLELCPGANPDRKEYKKNIENLTAVLRGKKKSVLQNLKKEMESASLSQDYEKAAKLRDRIEAMEQIISHTSVLTKPWQNYYGGRIEAYDVSNIQGQYATGSMVTFINNKPDKNFYRRFKIKIEGKPNDTAMLKEVLIRRFGHAEWPYPDLILIDGGKTQLNAAIQCLVPGTKHVGVVALAKKENKLYIEGKKEPILLKTLPREIFNLILQLRDEAHRFAISYHKKLRDKALFQK